MECHEFLFSESAGRFIIEAKPGDIPRLKKIFNYLPFMVAGKVDKNKKLNMKIGRGKLNLDVAELKNLWTAFSGRRRNNKVLNEMKRR